MSMPVTTRMFAGWPLPSLLSCHLTRTRPANGTSDFLSGTKMLPDRSVSADNFKTLEAARALPFVVTTVGLGGTVTAVWPEEPVEMADTKKAASSSAEIPVFMDAPNDYAG